MSDMSLHARIISQSLLPEPDTARPLQVLSAHRRALNLVDEAGDVLALVTAQVGAGPFHLVLAEEITFSGLRPGSTGIWQPGSIVLGAWRIDYTRAQIWDPTLPPGSLSGQAMMMLRTYVQQHPRFAKRWAGMNDDAIARVQDAAARLAQGVARRQPSLFAWGAQRLVGLGPGLTPAGDDYLLGILARLWLQENAVLARRFGEIVVHAAAGTTRISRAWLHYAARGQFDARWHALGQALTAADEAALCRAAGQILATGATSGPQALAGFLQI